MQIDTAPQQEAAVHQLSQQLASGMQLKGQPAAAVPDNTAGGCHLRRRPPLLVVLCACRHVRVHPSCDSAAAEL
jgi:hypothetical protein